MKRFIKLAAVVLLISSCKAEQETYSHTHKTGSVEAARAAERSRIHQREGGLNLEIDETLDAKSAPANAEGGSARTVPGGK